MSFLASTLSQFWLTIQATLFPWLEEELGELSEKQQQLVSILELSRIESFIRTSVGCQDDRKKIGAPWRGPSWPKRFTTWARRGSCWSAWAAIQP